MKHCFKTKTWNFGSILSYLFISTASALCTSVWIASTSSCVITSVCSAASPPCDKCAGQRLLEYIRRTLSTPEANGKWRCPTNKQHRQRNVLIPPTLPSTSLMHWPSISRAYCAISWLNRGFKSFACQVVNIKNSLWAQICFPDNKKHDVFRELLTYCFLYSFPLPIHSFTHYKMQKINGHSATACFCIH